MPTKPPRLCPSKVRRHYCDMSEARRVLGVSSARVRQLLLAKELQGFKLGEGDNSPWLIDRGALAYLKKTRE